MTEAARSTSPKVAVLLLNWHDEARTLKAAKAVSGLEPLGPLVVIDNEGTKESSRRLEDGLGAGWSVVRSDLNLGFGAAHNLGLSRIDELEWDSVLLLNTDATLDRVAFSVLVEALRIEEHVGAVGPVITDPPAPGATERTVQSAGGRLAAYRGNVVQLRRPPSDGLVEYLTFACVLIRRSALKRAGHFDERFFMYWEDVDLGVRIRRAGFELRVISEAHADHELSASADQAGSVLLTYGVWAALVFADKMGPGWKVSVRLRVLAAALRDVLRRRPARARSALEGLRMPRDSKEPAYLAADRWRRPRQS